MAIYTATANISCPHERCNVSASATGHSTVSMADAQQKADAAAKASFDSQTHSNHDS